MPSPVSGRRVGSTVTVAVAALAGVAAVVVIVALAHRLPVLINGLDTSRMTSLTSPIIVPLVSLALLVATFGTQRRTGPERWSAVAILVCLCDLALTYYSRARYSLGWYCGRSLTLVAAGVVLIAMLAAFRRLKARAEHEATIDPLTGLANRRSANAMLDQMFARSRRSGAPLGVLSLDLDLFKQVNDRYGHETGDTVLAEVARLLTMSCRAGDVVARVGGEEFLILLPDTDDLGTLVVAEEIRVLVADVIVPPMTDRMTASLGASTLREDETSTLTLLRRVDIALYQAKQAGRNRVVMAPSPPTRQPVAESSWGVRI
jgi:diguanylate cyclase (GGDEF)-like protein